MQQFPNIDLLLLLQGGRQKRSLWLPLAALAAFLGAMCCFGTAGVMVQLCDRMPAWVRHIRHLPKPKGDEIDSISSLFTALEEGGEMLIAIFAILAILQAHALYGKSGAAKDCA